MDGQDQAPAPGKVAVQDPESGNVLMIDAVDLDKAAGAGFKPLGQADALAGLKREYMESGPGKVATAGAGFVRGLSGGLSDLAFDRSGALSGSDLGSLADLNPVTSTLSHGAGFAASTFVPGEGEATTAAEGGSLLHSLAGGAPGALTGLGRLAEQGVGRLGGGELAGTLARGAVEGAGFQVADNLTEDVFKDKPLTAESLVANVGPAAALGAGGGLAFEKLLGLAKTAVPKTLEAAGDKLDDLKAWDLARSPEAKASEFAGKLDDFAQTRQDVIEDAVGVKRKLIEQALDGKNWKIDGQKFADNLEAVIKPIDEEGAHKSEALKAIGDYRAKMADAKTALNQFDATDALRARLGALASFDKDIAVNQIQRIRLQPLKDAFVAVRDHLEDPGIWGKAAEAQADFNAKLSPFINDSKRGDFVKNFFQRATDSADMEDAVGGKVSNEFKALQYAKRENMTTPEARMRAATARDALDRSIAQTHDLQQFAQDQAGKLATGDAKVRDIKAAVQALQDSRAAAIKAAGPSALEWADRLLVPLMGRGPIGWVGRLSKQGEVISKVAGHAAEATRAIAAGARNVLEGGPRGGADILAAGSPHVAHWLDLDRLAAHNADPVGVAGKLASSTATLQQHAPTIASAVQQTAAAASQYMQSIAPKNPVPPSGLPGQPKFEPSKVEMDRLRLCGEAIERPLSILDKARDGTLTSAHVAAVAQVYPRLYQKMVDETLQAIQERREPIGYSQQLMLSTLLQRPVGFVQEQLSPMFQMQGSATPQSSAPPGPPPRQGRASPSRMGKTRFASSAATGLDRAQGMDK